MKKIRVLAGLTALFASFLTNIVLALPKEYKRC